MPCIDADQVARAVVAPGTPGLDELVAEFGRNILQDDGGLNRAALRRLVFADTGRRRALEALLHPRIRRGLQNWRDALQADYGIMVVPILMEGGFDVLVDRILVVDVPQAMQLERLLLRDGIEETLAQQMLAAQSDRQSRLLAADDVLDNSGTPGGARTAVACLHQKYLQLSRLFAASASCGHNTAHRE